MMRRKDNPKVYISDSSNIRYRLSDDLLVLGSRELMCSNNQLAVQNNRFFRSAFTLTELIVAIVILIILLGITGMIYKASSEAVQQNNALVEIHQRAEAIRRMLREDLAHITKEGYLFLVRRKFSNLEECAPNGEVRFSDISARADKIIFWRTGDFTSFEDTSAHSNLALIYYCHPDISLSDYGISPADNSVVNHWVLARRTAIYIPNYSGTANDVLSTTFGQEINKNSHLPNPPLGFESWSNVYITFVPTINSDSKIYLILSQYCGSVRVRFLLPTEDGKDGIQNGVLDAEEDDGYANWPPDDEDGTLEDNVWLDLPDIGDESAPPGYTLHDYNSSDNIGVVCFTPDCPLWPKAIEFTVRLYDKNLSITSMDEFQTPAKEHAGLTFKFVIPLPD